ncbi:MAG: phosphoadenosine phosphosulfate reductase family protein, partial [Cetobacterium sp.]
MKKYTKENVYEKARERVGFIFDSFDKIYVSFSGGKDSSVCMHLACEEARRKGKKIVVLFIDTEAQYKMTIDHIKKVLSEYADVVIPMWVALPMESPNSLSYLEPTWIWWEREKESLWVRELPTDAITEENNLISFYERNMPFETFVKKFGDWLGDGENVACIQGIRADESLNRFRAIAKNTNSFKGLKWSTAVSKTTYNFYPIYDWRTEDIWTYNSKFGKQYNPIYDMMYKAGLSISQMRVDEPFGSEAKAGLNLFKVIEPNTWCKVVNRVSGANF